MSRHQKEYQGGQDWNVGKSEDKGLRKDAERAILLAVVSREQTVAQVKEHLDELQFLAETAGAITVKQFYQNLDHPDKRTYVGKGKLEEVIAYIEDHDIDLVIVDDDLSGKQTSILEKEIKRKILDRSSLILDIFANRAQTAQSKTQVELAQMQYLLPRLRGLWTHLERQRGGIGMRGPGEKEIETDRRIVNDKISGLKKQLAKIDKQTQVQRKNRVNQIRVALVGYTNAGKSTVMNTMSKSKVFAENKLFATLDTTVRKVVIERTPFLLSDTVGFIRKLPHHLIESFKSTLAEANESDMLLHVVDMSHPQYEDHIATVTKTLKELGAGQIPLLFIFNKIDQYRELYFDKLLSQEERNDIEAELRSTLTERYGENLVISAKTGEGIDEFKARLLAEVQDLYAQRFPYRTQHW